MTTFEVLTGRINKIEVSTYEDYKKIINAVKSVIALGLNHKIRDFSKCLKQIKHKKIMEFVRLWNVAHPKEKVLLP